MTFQYFFFDTYPGYFLQALPIALAVGAVYGILRYRRDRETPLRQKVCSCAFVCYLTGLFCLVIGLDVMRDLWYWLLYHEDSGYETTYAGGVNFRLYFYRHIDREVVGNFLMLLPFGVLHPLSCRKPSWKKTVLTGVLTVLLIEVLQPVFGRAFDVNDIVLNTLGILLSASAFMAARALARRA